MREKVMNKEIFNKGFAFLKDQFAAPQDDFTPFPNIPPQLDEESKARKQQSTSAASAASGSSSVAVYSDVASEAPGTPRSTSSTHSSHLQAKSPEELREMVMKLLRFKQRCEEKLKKLSSAYKKEHKAYSTLSKLLRDLAGIASNSCVAENGEVDLEAVRESWLNKEADRQAELQMQKTSYDAQIRRLTEELSMQKRIHAQVVQELRAAAETQPGHKDVTSVGVSCSDDSLDSNELRALQRLDTMNFSQYVLPVAASWMKPIDYISISRVKMSDSRVKSRKYRSNMRICSKDILILRLATQN